MSPTRGATGLFSAARESQHMASPPHAPTGFQYVRIPETISTCLGTFTWVSFPSGLSEWDLRTS